MANRTKLTIGLTHPGARVTTCALRGELDADSSATFRETMAQLQADGHRHVVLDAVDLAFVDSTGIRALVDADQALRRAGGSLRLRRPGRPVDHVLRIADLHDHFVVP